MTGTEGGEVKGKPETGETEYTGEIVRADEQVEAKGPSGRLLSFLSLAPGPRRPNSSSAREKDIAIAENV